MKLIIVMLALSLSPFAIAQESAMDVREQHLLDCKVSEIIDGSVFEEALSIEEYPDVDLINVIESDSKLFPIGLALSVGANRDYTEADGDTITTQHGDRQVTITAQYKRSKRQLTIVVERAYTKARTRKGLNKYRKADLFVDGDIVAELRCK